LTGRQGAIASTRYGAKPAIKGLTDQIVKLDDATGTAPTGLLRRCGFLRT